MRTCRSLLASAWTASTILLAGPAEAQSAYDQLVDACRQSGGNCNPTVPNVPAPTRESAPPSRSDGTVKRAPAAPAPKPRGPTAQEQMAIGLAGGIVEALFSSIFSSEPEGPSPEELARIERQRIAEAQARAAVVAQQRSARDAQQASNMDAMAAAMSSGWDTPADDGTAVALKGTTPALFAPPANPLAGRPSPPPSAGAERLARMAAENQDVALLTQRLSELSVKLQAASREADLLKRSSQRRVEEYQGMEETVARGVADAQERGMSMAFDGLFAANGKALQALSEVQASGRAWSELKAMLHETQKGAEFIHGAGQNLEQWSDDAAFAARQRDLKADLVYLGKRLGGPYAEMGESILLSARTVREQLTVLHRQGELNGFEKGYQARLDRVHLEMNKLLDQVKDVRGQLARRTGLAETDIALPAPPPHRGLGAEVPSLAE